MPSLFFTMLTVITDLYMLRPRYGKSVMKLRFFRRSCVCSNVFLDCFLSLQGTLKICQLPSFLSYDNYWPVQKVGVHFRTPVRQFSLPVTPSFPIYVTIRLNSELKKEMKTFETCDLKYATTFCGWKAFETCGLEHAIALPIKRFLSRVKCEV